MSTSQPVPPTDDPNTTTAVRTTAPEPLDRPKRLDLSLTKILGGALAAMTAAALGSRLSVAGTVVGAALASIVAAVAGSLYTASLSRTRDKVKTVWTGRSGGGETPTEVQTATQSDTWAWAAPARPAAPPPATEPNVGAPRRRVSWKSIVVATLATFALAAVLLTGFELVTGHALSGGKGTTISQVGTNDTKPKPKPTAQASSSASPSAEPSDTPTSSSAPSSSAPSASSSTTGSTQPTSTPSAPATATPSETPSSPTTPTEGAASAPAATASPQGR